MKESFQIQAYWRGEKSQLRRSVAKSADQGGAQGVIPTWFILWLARDSSG
jgi:hypothetical protein